MSLRILKSLVLLALPLVLSPWSAHVRAEDIDLFMTTSSSSNSLSNVLIILDNSANWSSSMPNKSTKFATEQAALRTAVTNLTVDSGGRATVRLGIMMFSESGSSNPSPPGGVVRFAVRDMDAAGKAAMLSFINSLDVGADKGSGANYALSMHEAYLYMKGLTAYAGANKAKADSTAFTTKPTYRAPSTTGSSCGKNIVIMMSNGAPDNGENTTSQSLLTALGGKLGTDPIKLNPSGKQANWSDEYARFMDGKKLYTYTIDVNPLTTGNGPDNTALLKSMAARGEGAYFAATDSNTLLNAINSILNSITALNTVFAATALPVSVNVRGTYLNEIYMAVFRPDSTAKPRWFGNLKLYQLGIKTSTGGGDSIFFADVNGAEALDSQTGFLKFDAPSFWTKASTYWDYSPRGTPSSSSDYPDGEVVEKGGAAQIQRDKWTSAGRLLYTCSSGCSAGALSEQFTTSNTAINPSSGTSIFNNASTYPTRTLTKADVGNLINWIRGQDVSAERTTGTTSAVRPSIHGDVVHSRPAVVSYNRTGNDDDIVVYYGASDGVLRAVQGGKVKSTLSGAADPGTELWGFVAPEFYTNLVRLYDNAPNINVPATSTSTVTATKPVANNKPYFFDGNFTVYAYDKPDTSGNGDGKLISGDGDKVYLYVTARRGGRLLYAFDVSNPTAPRFLWRKNGADTSAGNADFRELGFTWSEAKVVKLKLSGGDKTALIFGAGYDPAAEDDNPAGTATMGRGVYVVDAETGNLIWRVGPTATAGNAPSKLQSNMTKTFPADVTVLDRDGDGYADRVYAVDTGANVWRLDIGNANTSNWKVTRIAALGTTASPVLASDTNARKFLTAPDVVYAAESDGTRYDAVLVGSGDREKPFDSVVANRFYMLKDSDVTGDSTRSTALTEGTATSVNANTLYDATDNLVQEGGSTTANITLLRQAGGWYIKLGAGEKISGAATTIAGSVFFGSNAPAPSDPSTCVTNLGVAKSYGFSYKDASATFEFDNTAGFTKTDRSKSMINGGLLPSPTPIVVELNGERRLAVCFGPTCLSFKQSYGRRGRVFWSKTID